MTVGISNGRGRGRFRFGRDKDLPRGLAGVGLIVSQPARQLTAQMRRLWQRTFDAFDPQDRFPAAG
jgi:hypothetical protein